MALADRIDEKKSVKLDELTLARLRAAQYRLLLRQSELVHAERELQTAAQDRIALIERIGQEHGITINETTTINFDTGEISQN